MHGLALNLRPSLDAFKLFTPCGVSDAGVTSLLALTGEAPTPIEAAFDVMNAITARIERAQGVDAGGAPE